MPNGSDKGQATVELALVLPLVVMLFLAIVQVAIVGRDHIALSHAAREASRVAVESPEPAAVRTAATGATELDPDRLSVRLSGGTDQGENFTVEVTYVSLTDVPLVGRFFPDLSMQERFSGRVG